MINKPAKKIVNRLDLEDRITRERKLHNNKRPQR